MATMLLLARLLPQRTRPVKAAALNSLSNARDRFSIICARILSLAGISRRLGSPKYVSTYYESRSLRQLALCSR